ncbi:anti-sigma factor family protein [Wenzhouxiangella marina]|uniref:Uncharacterized protein n=1 Tax=Wenzhouxiangella marina TaxID=1579979 RepID=A0A0K0XTV9_9GAMM|nr:hypothetical protein [Wenzhouxiangella marina]AKS41118.1 hypothetical protein WM2015_737 [Wenzhouxiangella marina]MBB6087997.1 hypothetical protein [Wenzhouxiangella marina]
MMNTQDPTRFSIDDVTLSAWLDEELDASEARQVQAAVDAQPELQQRVARMMVNERRLREHYTDMAQARPMPEALTALLMDDEPAPRPWFLRLTDWSLRTLPRPALATAALALALVVGIQLGEQGDSTPALSLQELAQVDPGHAWFELLESAPAGQTVSLDGAQRGQVALSYRDADGDWCRQFEIQSPAEGSALAAVACRAAGRWQIGLAQPVPLRQQDEDVFRAASGDQAPAIDAYIMEHLAGDLLLGADETEVIEQGWP